MLDIAALADTSDCNVNLLQQRIELSSVLESRAKQNVSMLMPDAVTVATFLGASATKPPSSDGNISGAKAKKSLSPDGNISGAKAKKTLSTDANTTPILPTEAERLFDEMEEEFNRSEQGLAAAEDMIDEFKKQTALEINWGQKAAIAQARKLDALKQMNDHLNASARLERQVSHAIPSQVGSVLPGKTARAENFTSQAAEHAAEAARLAEEVSWAEGNYTVAIEAAKKARLKRNKISARMQSFLDASLLSELNVSRHVKVINNTFYLNLSGESVIEVRIKGNASGVDLTDIIQADIDKSYPSITSTNETEQPTSDVPKEPTIVVKIVNEGASDGKETKNDGSWVVLPTVPYIIGLAILLGVALAVIATMRR